MQEKAQGHMGSPYPLFSLHFIKHLTLSVLLIATSCVYFLASSFLTILVMVLPTSLFFAFSKRKQHQESNTLGKPQGVEVNCEGRVGKDNFEQRNGAYGVCGDEGEAEEILLDTMDQILACCNSSMSDDEWQRDPPDQIPSSSDDEDIDRARASSESSISDEESLIEITLLDGHTIFRWPNSKGFAPGLSPEMVLRQQELLEILSEMNEEDNLIEIDIATGSVKCST